MDRKDAVYTVNEVAEILKINPYTVQELLREGRLKGFKIRSHWRVSAEELQRYMGQDRGFTDS